MTRHPNRILTISAYTGLSWLAVYQLWQIVAGVVFLLGLALSDPWWWA